MNWFLDSSSDMLTKAMLHYNHHPRASIIFFNFSRYNNCKKKGALQDTVGGRTFRAAAQATGM